MRDNLIIAPTIIIVGVLGTPSVHADSILNQITNAKPKTTKVHKRPKKPEVVKIPIPIEYTVVAGDTLESLSEAHTTTWKRVWDKNPTMTHPDLIKPGDRLIIPQNNEILPDRPLPTPITPAPIVETTVITPPTPVIGECGDNQYAQYIYQKESGCNLNAVNAGGCRGIGQACPGSKLPCGADYACQNAFFTAYANSTYGGWEGAYNAWLAQGWW